jgi:hypothetical protein
MSVRARFARDGRVYVLFGLVLERPKKKKKKKSMKWIELFLTIHLPIINLDHTFFHPFGI